MNDAIFILSAFLLILLSAICSGLNVALLSLKPSDVRRKSKLGNRHAKRVLPIRTRVHFYLSGILLANVAFASGASILLGSQLNGLYAVFISTILLVVFAEIMPQAFAVKRSLHAVSFFARPIRIVSLATFPVTKPLQLLLDKIAGKGHEKLHSRGELGLLISDHHGDNESELDNDEVEIVQNAILMSEKRVSEIMTPVNKVYYLLETDKLDAKKIDKLSQKNWSRIPIFNKSLTRCKSFILLKDLVDVDFSEKSYKLSEIRSHKAKSVGSMTALDTMFRKFIAAKSHMMVVKKDKHIIGIVTIEDLIEEIIGHEIVDETDVANDR